MTCIVGIAEGGKVWIGGDSAGVAGLTITVRADRKVFKNEDFIMGFCGSFRVGQLLAHSFKPPRRHPDDDVYKFMVTTFVDGVRQCLKDGGVAGKEKEVEAIDSAFLVGYAGRLFKIECDYQVGESELPYEATGCGQEFALGSLRTTADMTKLSPAKRLTVALEAAERFSAGVRGPFHIVSTGESS